MTCMANYSPYGQMGALTYWLLDIEASMYLGLIIHRGSYVLSDFVSGHCVSLKFVMVVKLLSGATCGMNV